MEGMGHFISIATQSSPETTASARPPVFEVGEPSNGSKHDESDAAREIDPLFELEDEDEDMPSSSDVPSSDHPAKPEEEEKKANSIFESVKGMEPRQIAGLDCLHRLALDEVRKGSTLQLPDNACVIVVDLETTGLIRQGKKMPRMTELSAVSLSDPSDFISTLVKVDSETPIEIGALRVSGITAIMCNNHGKSETEALLGLTGFIESQLKKQKADKAYLVAHNALRFDAKIIADAFERLKFQSNLDTDKVFWVDSLIAARQSGRQAQNSLDALMGSTFPAMFDEKSMHRALADCFALCSLVQRNSANVFGSLFSRPIPMKNINEE